MKTMCNIGISSHALWVYLDGDKNPVRGFADANCDVFIGMERIDSPFKRNKEYYGERASASYRYIEYSDKHIIKIRSGWDGFSDAYGEIKITPSPRPFHNNTTDNSFTKVLKNFTTSLFSR